MSNYPNAYALVVGIANYQNITSLPPVVLKDAEDVYNLLVDPDHCGYDPSHVQCLLDAAATQAALRTGLARLAECSGEDDTVFLYITGHGGQITTTPYGGEYLLPVDVDYHSAESIAQTAISGVEFSQALRAIPARRVIVILDCCHSGGIGQPKAGTAPAFKTGFSASYYEALHRGEGRAILAASASDEEAVVMHGDANSLFTKHLLNGLRGGITSTDGLIRIFAIFEYVQPRVTGEYRYQTPVFKAELKENFPVALRRGGEPQPKAVDTQGYSYDAFISYVDEEPDFTFVWENLMPCLDEAGLRVATSETVVRPGVARVMDVSQGIQEAKHTLLVLTERYMRNNQVQFDNILAQTKNWKEGFLRLVPITLERMNREHPPVWLPLRLDPNFVQPLDFSPEAFERSKLNPRFDPCRRLVEHLRSPLPRARVE